MSNYCTNPKPNSEPSKLNGNIHVKIGLEPWFSDLTTEMKNMLNSLVEKGMPKYTATEIFKDSIRNAIRDAVVIEPKPLTTEKEI